MKDEILICECCSPEHQIIFSKVEDDDNIYVRIHLYKPTFWGRLKYLFGYKSKYGAWDEIILNRKQIEKIKNY